MTTTAHISLTRRAAVAVALCLVLAGGIGAGIVGLIFGPAIFNQIDENRTAIRVSCHQLNKKITQSQAAAGASTALLITEIVESMNDHERAEYERAAAEDAGGQLRTVPCKQVAERAYD